MPCTNQSMMSLDCNDDNISHPLNNTISSSTIPENLFKPLIPDIVVWWVRMAAVGILLQIVSVFGVVSNIINIIIFYKLGIKDPMNVSLLSLSISDFIGCFTVIWYNICLFPPFMDLELEFDQVDASYLYGKWPHLTAAKITTLITAFITVERCLCVTFPLKVKELITTKRITIVNVFIYLLNIASVVPIYYLSYYDWVYVPERNQTIYSMIFRENRDAVIKPLYFFIGVIIPVPAFILTIVSTIVLVHFLKKNAKWRQSATGGSANQSENNKSQNQMQSRDAKVAKMVVMISVLYLITFTPNLVMSFIGMKFHEIRVGQINENVVHAVYPLLYVLETINAAVNIFIYYSISSNYKAMFTAIFTRCSTTDKK